MYLASQIIRQFSSRPRNNQHSSSLIEKNEMGGACGAYGGGEGCALGSGGET